MALYFRFTETSILASSLSLLLFVLSHISSRKIIVEIEWVGGWG